MNEWTSRLITPPDVGRKNQSGRDSTKRSEKPTFIVVFKQRKQAKVLSTTYGRKSYKDSDIKTCI